MTAIAAQQTILPSKMQYDCLIHPHCIATMKARALFARKPARKVSRKKFSQTQVHTIKKNEDVLMIPDDHRSNLI